MSGAAAIEKGRRNRLRPLVWGGAAALLALPALAMWLAPASGVNWTLGDFIGMGVLLAIACGIYELGALLSGHRIYRAGFGLAVLTGFLTVWVNLAVGLLGSEDGSANLMFAGVLLIAAAGALAAGFKPLGMSRAMCAAAIAQLLAVGVGAWMDQFQPRELIFSAMFALPWIASALLFRRAADDHHGITSPRQS